MKIEGNKKTPESRRFSAAKPDAPKAGGKSFGALLKQASAPAAPAAPPVTAPAPEAAAPKPAEAQAESQAPAKEAENFADHMETVRFRLKTGYYSSKAIDDALTDKLTGYFDELA